MDSFDGMRNYFAYHDYITQGKSDNFFLFEKMNYPFGDYIFYTDNTPLIAVPLKWFSENIYDLSFSKKTTILQVTYFKVN